MKRLLSLLMAFTIMLSLCACQGNFGSINLNDAIAIPEDGVIPGSIIKQIKNENAIGVFAGESNGLRYEWTIFGSDISEPKEINLVVSITRTVGNDLKVTLSHAEAFGFSCLLSIHLDEKWAEDSATAYHGDKAVASVSLTGSKDNTILNCILDGSLGEFVIKPDALPQEDDIPAETEVPTEEMAQPTQGNDDYLSKPEDSDVTVYTDGKDKYLTDPIPEGKPKPVEPEDQDVDKGKTYTCTFSIECSTILNNLDLLDPE